MAKESKEVEGVVLGGETFLPADLLVYVLNGIRNALPSDMAADAMRDADNLEFMKIQAFDAYPKSWLDRWIVAIFLGVAMACLWPVLKSDGLERAVAALVMLAGGAGAGAAWTIRRYENLGRSAAEYWRKEKSSGGESHG